MAWTTMKTTTHTDQKHAKLVVNCLSTEQGSILYAAGVVYVTIGHGPQQRAVACRAGTERCITTPEHAPEWLAERGLSPYVARNLIGDALLDEEQRRARDAEAPTTNG